MKKKRISKTKGYVALTVVLMLTPLLLSIGINAIYRNISIYRTEKITFDHNLLEINAETCLEESVVKIKREPTFTGVYIVTQPTWSCESNILDKTGETGIKLIDIKATDNNGNFVSLKKQLNISTDPFEISNI